MTSQDKVVAAIQKASAKQEKLLAAILEEQVAQNKLTTFIAISGFIVGIYLIAYTVVLITLGNPTANYTPFLNFAFDVAFIIAISIVIIVAGIVYLNNKKRTSNYSKMLLKFK